MDYRKNMNTPRDMVDEELLLRLMRENEPAAGVFGGNVRRENRRRPAAGNCGCGNPEITIRREVPEPERNRCECREQPEETGCRERESRRENGGFVCEPCAKDERMKMFALAMAYVPIQEWERLYDEETALARGTLFEALDLPWDQSACGNRNDTCRKCGDNR